MHQVTVTPAPSQQPSPRRLAPSTRAMSMACEGFSQRNSRIASSIRCRNGHSMRSGGAAGNLYLYEYTVVSVCRRLYRRSYGQPHPWLRALDHILRNRHKVQQAAGHHEQVPDTVPVEKALVVGVKDNAHRVEHATGHQPGKAL